MNKCGCSEGEALLTRQYNPQSIHLCYLQHSTHVSKEGVDPCGEVGRPGGGLTLPSKHFANHTYGNYRGATVLYFSAEGQTA